MITRLVLPWATADVVSVVGTRLLALAIPWFVLTSTGSAAQTGAVAFAEMAPMVLAKALGGPLIDRIGAARVAVAADLVSVPLVLAIPLLHAAGLLSMPLLIAIVAVLGTARGPGDAAKQALVPEVSGRSGWSLERISGIAGTSERLASTVGLAAGGVLIAAVGAIATIWVTAVALLGCAALIGLLVRPALRPVEADRSVASPPAVSTLESHESPSTPTGYVNQLREGWRFVMTDPVILAITIMVALTNLLDQAWVIVLVPSWALRHDLDASAVGWTFAVMTGGAVVGSALASLLAERLPRRPVYLIAFLLAGAPRYAAPALDLPLLGVLAVVLVSGFASGFINPILSAVLFERIPTQLVGRVSALTTAICWSLMPFGGLLAAALMTPLGVSGALWACGALYLVVTVAPALLPAWRELDDRRIPQRRE